MNVVEIFTEAALSVGYREEAIVPDYTYADVLAPDCPAKTVSVAAFTQTPPSYRSAAFAAVPAGDGDPQAFANGHRALGIPALFVVNGGHASLWEIRGAKPSKYRECLPIDDVPRFFRENKKHWKPERIHKAKSIGAVDHRYQLDFVDVGLLPAVEGEIHVKLDSLLRNTLNASRNANDDKALSSRDLFRLLAAKVLLNRRHADAGEWRPADPNSVLQGIESYYDLHRIPSEQPLHPDRIAAAWECLRGGLDFANISSEDLAYIYEKTLVTPETRRRWGTHSTPRQLAEYAVSRLQLHQYDPELLQIYEPFAGAAPFLVSTIRYLRDLLPAEWSDAERHKFLIHHVRGDEIDAFAREAAVLSLILADYPNRNGWRISEIDLFTKESLTDRMSGANVILCNPPFEDFHPGEREHYPISGVHFSKPIAVLDAALAVSPVALAFVLPHSFIRGRKFISQRKRVEELYSDIEIVDLPEGIFRHSAVESALLIAHTPRRCDRRFVSLRSTRIARDDRGPFLKSGKVTEERVTKRSSEISSGDLWIPALRSVWEYMVSLSHLDDEFEIHLGLEWKRQKSVAIHENLPGYKQGLHTSRGMRQFRLAVSPVYLDVRAEKLRGNAIDHRWKDPKLIVNAARLSRGPWRIAATPDTHGLLFSRQFIGLWPRRSLSDSELLAFVAILNGPVANAFLAIHSPAKRIRIADIRRVPVPRANLFRIGELVARYISLAERATSGEDSERLARLLTEIDAMVLGAYDLPARLEKHLLGYFRRGKRPVAHEWRHWDDTHPMPGLTLAERLSGRYRPHGSWILDVFRPLPGDEARILREYGVP